jgi:hypothetical protein
MQIFDQAEINSIEKTKKSNDDMEVFFQKKRDQWKTETDPLYISMKADFSNIDNAKKVMDIQTSALAYRQNIGEEISFFLNKRSREEVKLKMSKQEKIVWYAVGSPLAGKKFTAAQLTAIVDAHIAETERTIQLIDVHIDFLRDLSKRLNDIPYTFKNLVDLMNYLSKI